MNRRTFLHQSTLLLSALTTTVMGNNPFQTFTEKTPKMPVLFMGHGNPMNAVEDNDYTRGWAAA